MDDVTEDVETFLLSITGVVTDCPFEIENNVATVEIRDREGNMKGKVLGFSQQLICVSDILAKLEFTSPQVTVAEIEGAVAEVCVRLVLLNNETKLTQSITTDLFIESGLGASK